MTTNAIQLKNLKIKSSEHKIKAHNLQNRKQKQRSTMV